jgi:hypothetical protein
MPIFKCLQIECPTEDEDPLFNCNSGERLQTELMPTLGAHTLENYLQTLMTNGTGTNHQLHRLLRTLQQ